MTAAGEGASGGAARLLEEVAWQELVPWFEQLPDGETERLRNNRSIEGSSGLRRLTGQKAEPPWVVKLTLLGSGQEEIRAGFCSRGTLKRNERREAVRKQTTKLIPTEAKVVKHIKHGRYC